MNRLFQSLARRIALGNIPSWSLIVVISLPVWIIVSFSSIFISLLRQKYLQAHMDYVIPTVAQHLLQHALLYPLLVACYWFAIKNCFSHSPTARKIPIQLGLATAFS